MRVVVTGAGGFVGQRLCRRLVARGHEPRGFDRELDVADAPRVAARLSVDRPGAVVHLAAVSHVPDAARDPELAWRVNFAGARAVLEGALSLERPPRVLLVGSSLVYGAGAPHAAPFDEASALRPATPYAWTKAAADRLGGVYGRRGLEVVRARPFNHTGPGRPDHFVESSFARQIAEMEGGRRALRLEVGNLDSLRDFLHVDDVVDAYLELLEPAVPAGVYNVASGRGTRVGTLLDALLRRSRIRPEVVVRDDRWRPTDASVGDASRLASATGWTPRRSLDEALDELLADWRQRLGVPA